MLEDYVALDLEMTGLNAKKDTILEVGAVRIRDGRAAAVYGALLRTETALPEKVTELTGITREMAEQGREPEEAMEEFFAFLGEDILVGHNIIYDYGFLKQWAVNHRFPFERSAVDTLKLARKFLPKEQKKNLGSLCGYFDIPLENAHRALDDALAAHKILERLKEQYGDKTEEAFSPRPLVYQAKRQTPATERQKQYLRRYAGHFALELPENLETMTRSEASRLTDLWISAHGKWNREQEH